MYEDCIKLNPPNWYDRPCQGYPTACYRCREYEKPNGLEGLEARLKSLEESNTLPVNHAHKLKQTQTALRDLQKKVSIHLKNNNTNYISIITDDEND